MSQLDAALREMSKWAGGAMKTRLESEMLYAKRVSNANGGAYDALIERALSDMKNAVAEHGALTDERALAIEASLMPMQAACKKYKLLMVGHAHIDMNWMWRYDETVSITLDTFRTALNLMKEFPKFTFAQSQASTYRIVEQFEPSMIEEIKARIKAGQWEVSASTWVEADRNMPSAESVARHHLYTKRYLPKLLDLDISVLNFDFEPDTFGHHQNVPELLCRAGVKFYYHCRGEEKGPLYRWRSPSGAEIVVYREPFWYLGAIGYDMAEFVPEFCERYGLTTAMRVYGVGDHGGGPTRRDLERIEDMGKWPIYPEVEFGTYKRFYQDVDRARENLPVLTGERNFIFTGCYTTQTRIKMGNKIGEGLMREAEAFGAFAHLRAGAAYDRTEIEKGWRNILFNQFHDIIPGSGVIDTREHAMGQYQEAYAIANSLKREALSKIAGQIDTSEFVPTCNAGTTAEGAGVGFGVYPFKIAQVERGGGASSRVFHLFNPLPRPRSCVAEVVLWDFQGDLDRIEVVDANGNTVRHQLIGSKFDGYWGHDWMLLLLEADLPALGYASYGLRLKDSAEPRSFVRSDPRKVHPVDYTLENEHIKARFCELTGALVSLIDKSTGKETLGEGGAGFRVITECPDRGMTSWTVGRYMKIERVQGDTLIKRTETGELRNALTIEQSCGFSKLKYTVSLKAGASALDYDVSADWLEVGSASVGIPQLNFGARLIKPSAKYLYDIPMGVIRRDALPEDMPSQGMIASEDENLKTVLMSNCKYGFRGDGDEISVTLIRSSFDPDPFPELGQHTFKLSLGVSHACCDAALLNQAQAWNHQPIALSGSNHAGSEPLCASFAHLEGKGLVFSAIKLQEDEDALIVRGFEANGEATRARIDFGKPVTRACLVDSMEQPVVGNVDVDGTCVGFEVPAYSLFTVKVVL